MPQNRDFWISFNFFCKIGHVCRWITKVDGSRDKNQNRKRRKIRQKTTFESAWKTHGQNFTDSGLCSTYEVERKNGMLIYSLMNENNSVILRFSVPEICFFAAKTSEWSAESYCIMWMCMTLQIQYGAVLYLFFYENFTAVISTPFRYKTANWPGKGFSKE